MCSHDDTSILCDDGTGRATHWCHGCGAIADGVLAGERPNRWSLPAITTPQWTTEPPTKPGWYWARQKDKDPSPVWFDGYEVWTVDQKKSADAFDLWCGPIHPPEVPK